jgi:hypothetical protein
MAERQSEPRRSPAWAPLAAPGTASSSALAPCLSGREAMQMIGAAPRTSTELTSVHGMTNNDVGVISWILLRARRAEHGIARGLSRGRRVRPKQDHLWVELTFVTCGSRPHGWG